MEPLGIGIVGCAGRMGRMAARVVDDTEGCRLAGGTEHQGASGIGRDLGELAGIGAKGLPVGDDPAALFAAADAVIDFTTPAALLVHAGLAQATKTIGSPGSRRRQDGCGRFSPGSGANPAGLCWSLRGRTAAARARKLPSNSCWHGG